MDEFKKYKEEQKKLEGEITILQNIYLNEPEEKNKEKAEFKNMALVTFNWEADKEAAIYFQTERYKLIEKIRRFYIEFKKNYCSSDNVNNTSRQVEEGNNSADQKEENNEQKYRSGDRNYTRLGEDSEHPLKFSQADEPLDIIWQNIPYKNEMFYERLKIKFYIFLLVCANTALSYGILST